MANRFVKPAGATFDATGAAEVSITPPGGYDWHVTVTSVTTTSTAQSTATVDIDGQFHEGTYAGDRDTSDTVYTLADGSTLTCRWTGGTVGARASLTLRGIQARAGT